MYVLSETVFENWVTFQYHVDAMSPMKLQLIITISVSVFCMVLERNNLSIIDSEINGPGRIFNFNMLFAREFLHIFICLVGIFDVFFRVL